MSVMVKSTAIGSPQTVYVTITNDEVPSLNQQDWAHFCADVNQHVRRVTSEILGPWYALPNAYRQSVCWGMVLDEDSFLQLQQNLALACRVWARKSITFAVARVKFISGGEQS